MGLIDENTFVTGHTKSHIKIWDINTLEVIKTIDTLNKFRFNNPAGINTLGDIRSLDVNHERNLIATYTGLSFFLYDYSKDSIIILDIEYDFFSPERKFGPAKFTPNMQEVVYQNKNELVFMDLNTLEHNRSVSLSYETIILDIEFSPDGRYMAYSTENRSIDPDGHDVEVIELSTLKTVYRINSLEFSTSRIEFWDNQFLVVPQRPFEIHDIIKKEKVADFGQFEPNPFGSIILERHPSGNYLLSSPRLTYLGRDILTGVVEPELANQLEVTYSSGILNIKLPENIAKYSINILNLSGQIIANFKENSNSWMIEKNINLPAGIYFVEMHGSSKVFIGKFVVAE
jgi:WD40 repeat protein